MNRTILRFRENFELLARKGSEWLISHSLKSGNRENRTDLKSYNKQRQKLVAICCCKNCKIILKLIEISSS